MLLVYTRYKPRTHNLALLRKLVNTLDPRFITAFALGERQDRERFDLLRRAYIEARYHKNYAITPTELTWLAERVKGLQALCEVACQEKIKIFLTEK